MFPALKPFQEQALAMLRRVDHTILIAPTGSGKSLIFQKFLHENRKSVRAVLFSPLNALGRQIASDLHRLKIPVRVGIGKEGESIPEESGVWIISPEKINGASIGRLKSWSPNFMIVDEAHCVWEWGRDFRPAFARLPGLVTQLAIPKTFWCTATLPEPARDAIAKQLPGSVEIIGDFSVPDSLEIAREHVPAHLKLQRLRSALDRVESESGMIFVSSRASAERLQQLLSAWSIDSIFYHAGLFPEERKNLELKLASHSADYPIWVVATSAFGMGMNYPFLKNCIVYEPSLSVLALAQALGRVGRSGASAKALVFWNENDFQNLAGLVGHRELAVEALCEVRAWCASPFCAKRELEKYFHRVPKSGTINS